MNAKEMHELLKNTLSPEEYIDLLKLMVEDVEKIARKGYEVKDKTKITCNAAITKIDI